MGSGVSRLDIEQHLQRQQSLIDELQSLLGSTGNKEHPTLQPEANDFTVPNSGKLFETPPSLNDEIGGFDQKTIRCEKKVTEPEVTEYEKQLPNVDWLPLTDVERENMLYTAPWMTVMEPPLGFVYNETDNAPDVKLELEYVYGFRSSGVRNVLHWIDSQTILYCAGAVSVVHDLESGLQKFFQQHTEEITCIGVARGLGLVVSGEQGRYPAIHVWEAKTQVSLMKLSGTLQHSIRSVAISDDGQHVAAVAGDDCSTVAIFDWQRGKIEGVADGSETHRKVLEIRANRETVTTGAGALFISVGEGHIVLWSIASHGKMSSRSKKSPSPDGQNIYFTPLTLGRQGDVQTFTTVASCSDFNAVGTQNGEVYLFRDTFLMRTMDCHYGPVLSIAVQNDFLFTGGHDGYVSQWSAKGGLFKRVRSTPFHKSSDPDTLQFRPNSIRAVDVLAFCRGGGDVLVGSIGGCIDIINGGTGSVRNVVTAHHGDLFRADAYGEVTGLATNPKGLFFVSVAEYDVILWNALRHEVIKKVRLPSRGQCATWSPCSNYIVVGMYNGACIVFNSTLERHKDVQVSSRRVQCMRFSPDSSILAVCTADHAVEILNGSSFELEGKIGGFTGVILSVDFSHSGQYLQCMTQAFELLYFDLHTLVLVDYNTARSLIPSIGWSTFTSLLGWNVQGIWPYGSQLNDVHALVRSADSRFIVTGEESGIVKIFNFPCVGGGISRNLKLEKRPESHRHTGHGEKVTQVQFLDGDSRVITAGGGDLSCFQWRVVPNESP